MQTHGGDYKDLVVFLAAAGVMVPLVNRLKISPVLGFLAAGVVLGPDGLARFADRLPWLSYFMPGFHPWNHDDRALIGKYESDYADAVMPAHSSRPDRAAAAAESLAGAANPISQIVGIALRGEAAFHGLDRGGGPGISHEGQLRITLNSDLFCARCGQSTRLVWPAMAWG